MNEPDADGARQGRSQPLLRAFSVVAVPAFVVIASWALAMPRDSGPDEPSHVVHAAAVDRGQWVGATNARFPGFTFVTVPEAFSYAAGIAQEGCFQAPPTTPATCQPPWRAAGGAASSGTYSGRYPPLYYAIVGLPTLGSSSSGAFYAMRLMSALASAILLGLAAAAAANWSQNRLLRLGILLAATPMALYAAAVVNPSGLEISAAVCLWVAGLVLVREHLDEPPAGLVAIVAVAAAVLVLARPISPLWLGVIGLSLVVAGDPRAALASLRRQRHLQVALGAVAAATVLAVAWVLAAHSFDVQHGLVTLPANASALDVLRASLHREGTWLRELVGIFGSHETDAPLPTYLVWAAAVAALGVAAIVLGRRRDLAVLAGLAVVCLAVPVALQFLHARSLGIVWQGRYTLPVAVGIPILATAVLGDAAVSARRRRQLELAAVTVVAGVATGSFLAFGEALRRYAVGTSGPIFFDHPAWQPTGGVVLWLVVNLVATSWLAAALWRRRETVSHRADVSPATPRLAGPGG